MQLIGDSVYLYTYTVQSARVRLTTSDLASSVGTLRRSTLQVGGSNSPKGARTAFLPFLTFLGAPKLIFWLPGSQPIPKLLALASLPITSSQNAPNLSLRFPTTGCSQLGIKTTGNYPDFVPSVQTSSPYCPPLACPSSPTGACALRWQRGCIFCRS